MEEDAASRRAYAAQLDRCGAERNKDLDWDILFTDICIANMLTMFELVKHAPGFRSEKSMSKSENLRERRFAG